MNRRNNYKVGDLVRYIRGREGAATRSLRRPEHIEWRDSRVGLILREANWKEDLYTAGNWIATVMYYVVWNDTEQPQLTHDWNLELVSEEG